DNKQDSAWLTPSCAGVAPARCAPPTAIPPRRFSIWQSILIAFLSRNDFRPIKRGQTFPQNAPALSWNCNGEELQANACFPIGIAMLEPAAHAPKQVRTLFLSDIHLGMKGCQADKLLDFMRYYDADTVYLVGDIVDGWSLRSSWYWPQTHNDVVQKLLRKARKGSRMVYIPGNHDEFLRD